MTEYITPKIRDILRNHVLALAFYESHLDLPKERGVYLLFAPTGDLEYVGVSLDIRKRLGGQHDAYTQGFHRIAIVPIEDRTMYLSLERRLVEVLKPPLNTSLSPAQSHAARGRENRRKQQRRKAQYDKERNRARDDPARE